MAIMEWSPQLDVGVTKMNDEHKGLLDLMNKLHVAHANGRPGREILSILDALGKATVAHFADEERYMESVNYPKLRTHKLIHADLLRRFGEYSSEIHAKGGKMGPEFFSFLKMWLTAHIKGIDMEYNPTRAGVKRAV